MDLRAEIIPTRREFGSVYGGRLRLVNKSFLGIHEHVCECVCLFEKTSSVKVNIRKKCVCDMCD